MTHTLRGSFSLLAVGFLAVAGALLPFSAAAAEFKTGEQVSFSANESVQDDLYMSGAGVSSAGTIYGDGILAGGNVLLSGPVAGDAALAGGNLTITGDVSGDLRAAGGTVITEGGVGEDLIVGGGQVTVGGNGVAGDAVIAGGQITITAPVAGNLKIYGGEVFIDSAVGGSVSVHADKVTLGEHAAISGNFAYTAPKEATINEGATVAGKTEYTEGRARSEKKEGTAGVAALLAVFAGGVFLVKFLVTLVGALLLAYGLKRYTKEMVTRSTKKPWKMFVSGLVWAIVLPIVSVLLLITIVGIPFGVLGLIGFAAVMVIAHFLAAILIGAVLYKWITRSGEYRTDWKTILLGVFVYSLVLDVVPVVGWLIKCVVVLMVWGALWSIKKEVIQEWR